MALRSLKKMQERRSLQAAQAALFRVRDGRWARKADCPPYERERQRAQDRRDLATAVESLKPIVEARVEEAAKYDNECKAIASEAASARIGEVAPKYDPSGELQAFKSEVAFAISTAPTGQAARERVAALLAKEGVLAAFRAKR